MRGKGRNTVNSQCGTTSFAGGWNGLSSWSQVYFPASTTGCRACREQDAVLHEGLLLSWLGLSRCRWRQSSPGGGRLLWPRSLPVVTCCAPPSLPSFAKKVLRCLLQKGFQCLPAGLPCDPAHHFQCQGGSLLALPAPLPLTQGSPGLRSRQPARSVSLALTHSPPLTGQGRRAHFACQCEHAPHRIFAGTSISLILNIPSECLSTISLGRLLYLLINLPDKRFSPISILTSFSLNYIPIPYLYVLVSLCKETLPKSFL